MFALILGFNYMLLSGQPWHAKDGSLRLREDNF